MKKIALITVALLCLSVLVIPVAGYDINLKVTYEDPGDGSVAMVANYPLVSGEVRYDQKVDGGLTGEMHTLQFDSTNLTRVLCSMEAGSGQRYVVITPASGYKIIGWDVYEGGSKDTTTELRATSGTKTITFDTSCDDHTYTPVLVKEDQQTAGMNVNFTNAKAYTLKIPADFTVTDTETPAGDVNVSNVCLDTGDTLSVSLSSGYFDVTKGFRMKHHTENDYVTYTIKSGSTTLNANDVELFSIASGDEGYPYPDGKKVTLSFRKTGTPLYSGEYKDTLTFTADITST